MDQNFTKQPILGQRDGIILTRKLRGTSKLLHNVDQKSGKLVLKTLCIGQKNQKLPQKYGMIWFKKPLET